MTFSRFMLAGLVLLGASTARADRIRLRGGGEIKGVVVKDPAKPDNIFVQTETSSKLLTFPKNGITSVVREPSPLDDYVTQKAKLEDTAQAHYDFGLWCEESKLTGPAMVQFQAAVTLNPDFGAAHKKLGHVQHGSRWLTYDEQREAQGLVKYKGKWILKAEKDKIDAGVALGAEQSSWATRLKLLRAKLYDADPTVRESAETQIGEIRDPAAVPGLLRNFRGDNDAVRVRLSQLLAAIPGPEATEGMIGLVVSEQNEDVRKTMVGELIHKHDPDTATKLISLLKGKDSAIIGRAALTLAEMKQVAAVPRLVDALIQTDKKMMMVTMPTGGGGGGGGLSGSFGISQNLSTSSGFAGGVPLASNHSSSSTTTVSGATGGVSSVGNPGAQGFGTYYSQAYVTPTVAPGIVAFGATSVPTIGGSTAVSGSGPPQVAEMPARVQVRVQNEAVLKSLQMLTGVNYGFDQLAWKKWVSTEFKPDDQAPRRVPKP